jgi:hypothetical protein
VAEASARWRNRDTSPGSQDQPVQLESGSFLMIELKSILLHLSHVATPYNLESHAVELVNFSHQCAKHIFNTLSILD